MHVSFDFDYTLADSSEGTVVCANYALDKLGITARHPNDIRRTIGQSLEHTFESLTDDHGDEATAAFKQHFLNHAQEVMLSYIHFYDHTQRVLEALNRQGHYVSIVSTKLKERIEEALHRDGFSDFVNDVIGGGCVENNKPDPEGLLRAIKTSGLSEDETIYVGDSVSDGECASRAGIAFIGVLSGTTSRSKLERWKPSAVLKHVGELARVGSLAQ